MSDLTLDSLLIEGGKLRADLASAITKATLTRTIDTSPTLKLDVSDKARALLREGYFGQRLTAQVDGQSFEIAALSKKGNVHTITFEDLAVAELRRHNSFVKAAAGTISRVDFVRQLLRSETPWISLFVDQSVHEPVTKVEIARGSITSTTTDGVDSNYFGNASSSAASSANGSRNDAPVATNGGGALTGSQIAGAAKSAGFTGNNLVIAVAVALAESGGRPSASHVNSNKSTDYGLWQINSVHANLLNGKKWQDPAQNAQMAFSISGGGKNWSPWVTYKTGAYMKFMATAQSASGQPSSDYGSGTTTGSSSTDTSNLEDSWTCFKRLFAEVGWRLYADHGNLYAGPDSAFIDKAPAFIFEEYKNGIDTIDFDWDVGKPIATCKIKARASRWVCPPGTPVKIPNLGLPDKWIVSSISRSLDSVVTDIVVKAPEPELPEPETTTTGSPLDAYFGVNGSSAQVATGGSQSGTYIWPVTARTITSPFGKQRVGKTHKGLDIGVSDGTRIVAVADGTVTKADNSDAKGYGNAVWIDHGNGMVSIYGHMSSFSVRRGLIVKQGQLLGLSGHTGDATGPHLHLEFRLNGTAVDPIPYLSNTPVSSIIASSNESITVNNSRNGAPTTITNNIPLIP